MGATNWEFCFGSPDRAVRATVEAIELYDAVDRCTVHTGKVKVVFDGVTEFAGTFADYGEWLRRERRTA